MSCNRACTFKVSCYEILHDVTVMETTDWTKRAQIGIYCLYSLIQSTNKLMHRTDAARNVMH